MSAAKCARVGWLCGCKEGGRKGWDEEVGIGAKLLNWQKHLPPPRRYTPPVSTASPTTRNPRLCHPLLGKPFVLYIYIYTLCNTVVINIFRNPRKIVSPVPRPRLQRSNFAGVSPRLPLSKDGATDRDVFTSLVPIDALGLCVLMKDRRDGITNPVLFLIIVLYAPLCLRLSIS